MQRIRIAAMILVLSLLAGCTEAGSKGTDTQTGNEITSMEAEADLTYEVPVSKPSILINQLGYFTDGAKLAILTGSEMPDFFHVVDAESGDIVYTGIPEDKGYNEDTKEYCSYGVFTEFQTAGTYYIEAPVLGRSYTFSLEQNIYDQVFREACKQYYYNRCGITLTEEYAGAAAHNACHTGKAMLREDSSVSIDVSGGWHQDEKGQKDVVKASKNIAVMLLAYELFQESFTDDAGIPESGNQVPDILDEIKYEIEWLLKMQNQNTGEVYAGVAVFEQKGTNPGKSADIYVEPASYEAGKAFAMVLAKFSYLYQNYDTEYATNCLKAADRAWKYVNLNDTTETDSWKFAAAAELYRAAGQFTYHKYIVEYLTGENYKKGLDETSFLGCMTYISTKQKVTLSLCESAIKTIMDEAERVSQSARQSLYLTGGNEAQDNNGELLSNMMYLTAVDRIIKNHEYETIIENHLHYFMGRNAMAISYIDNVGANNYKDINNSLGIMKQFDADSKLIFMLSEIVGSHRKS